MGNGCTPVHIAAESGNLLVLRSLLQHGGDAQKEDKEGETALHKACKCCHFAIVKELIQFIHGFIGNTRQFVNKRNKKGETALHYSSLISRNALHFPDEDKMIVVLLMEQGADISLITEQTLESAIHYVAQSGNHNLLTEMMDHWDSRSSGPEERDLLKELHDSCVKMQPKLLRLAAGLDRNSSFFCTIACSMLVDPKKM